MKTGIELEYWVTDAEGSLASAEELASQFDFADREFVEPVLEIKTSPRKSITDHRNKVHDMLHDVIDEAHSRNRRIVPTGTPLNSGRIPTVDSKRSKLQEKIVGENLDYAKHVAGTHFHFEQENAAAQFNLLTALDPALALASSSSHHNGRRVAENARNQIYRFECYREFPDHGQLWSYISGKEDWNSRVEKRFQEFVSAAEEKSIEKESLDEHFSPSDSVWIPVRLRENFGTVEWRALDSTLPSHVFSILERTKKLVEEPGQVELPEFERVKELSNLAIEEGLQSPQVKDYLKRLGFDTQITLHNRITGRADNIGREKARQLRLKHAEMLEDDIKEDSR